MVVIFALGSPGAMFGLTTKSVEVLRVVSVAPQVNEMLVMLGHALEPHVTVWGTAKISSAAARSAPYTVKAWSRSPAFSDFGWKSNAFGPTIMASTPTGSAVLRSPP